MFSKKKAQVSLEYLIIFGFVIAAVLGVVAYLSTTGMFTPQQMVGDQQTGFTEVRVNDWAISGNQLQLVLTNTVQDSITIDTVYVTDDQGNTNTTTGLGVSLGSGETMDNSESADLPQNYDSGDTYTLDVAVEYDTGALVQNSTGTLSGTV